MITNEAICWAVRALLRKNGIPPLQVIHGFDVPNFEIIIRARSEIYDATLRIPAEKADWNAIRFLHEVLSPWVENLAASIPD